MAVSPAQMHAVADVLVRNSDWDSQAAAFVTLAQAVAEAENNRMIRNGLRPAFMRIAAVQGTWGNAPPELIDRLKSVVVL